MMVSYVSGTTYNSLIVHLEGFFSLFCVCVNILFDDFFTYVFPEVITAKIMMQNIPWALRVSLDTMDFDSFCPGVTPVLLP